MRANALLWEQLYPQRATIQGIIPIPGHEQQRGSIMLLLTRQRHRPYLLIVNYRRLSKKRAPISYSTFIIKNIKKEDNV